jgi:hypothetical protein
MITGAGFEQHADQIRLLALDGTGERTETRTLRSNGGVPVRNRHHLQAVQLGR